MDRRQSPGWQFSTLFLVKDSLAVMLESAHLYEDALREYSELEACYLEALAAGTPLSQQPFGQLRACTPLVMARWGVLAEDMQTTLCRASHACCDSARKESIGPVGQCFLTLTIPVSCKMRVQRKQPHRQGSSLQVAVDRAMMWRSFCLQPGGKPDIPCSSMAWCRSSSSGNFCSPVRPAFFQSSTDI